MEPLPNPDPHAHEVEGLLRLKRDPLGSAEGTWNRCPILIPMRMKSRVS